MIPLIIATFCSSSFGFVVKYAQARGRNLLAVGAVNYITASVVNALMAFSKGNVIPGRHTLMIGLMGGLFYINAFLLVVSSTRLKGVSITSAMIRLSVVIPVIFSIFKITGK